MRSEKTRRRLEAKVQSLKDKLNSSALALLEREGRQIPPRVALAIAFLKLVHLQSISRVFSFSRGRSIRLIVMVLR
jgi:hypothetical protein